MPPFDSSSKIPTAGNGRLGSRTADARNPGARTHDLDVAIVGGGISGLVTAFRLARQAEPGRNAALRLFEATAYRIVHYARRMKIQIEKQVKEGR